MRVAHCTSIISLCLSTNHHFKAAAAAEEMIAGGFGHGVYLTSDVPGEVHDNKDKNSGTLKLRVGKLDFPKTESAELFTSDNIKLGETDKLLGEVGGIGELDFLMTESADLLTSDGIKLGEADMPGFKMHKELADFFNMIEVSMIPSRFDVLCQIILIHSHLLIGR